MPNMEEFEGISSNRREVYSRADIDRWNGALALRDELDGQIDQIYSAMRTAEKDFRAHGAQIIGEVAQGHYGSYDNSPLARTAAGVRESYRVEDMDHSSLAAFSEDLMHARSEQKRVLDALNGSVERHTSKLKADQALGLVSSAGTVMEEMDAAAVTTPAAESEIHKEISGRLALIAEQRGVLSAIVEKMGRGEILAAGDVEAMSKNSALQSLAGRYAAGDYSPQDSLAAFSKYDELLQSQHRDLSAMLKEQEKHEAAQSAFTKAAGIDEQYAKSARRTMALEDDYQNAMLEAINQPAGAAKNREIYDLRIAPEKAAHAARMEGLKEQAEHLSAARLENDYGNLSMESWQKSSYARGEDISDRIIMKNDKGNVTGFDLPKDAEVVTKVDAAGKLQVTIRAANWSDSKERSGSDPDFQAVTFTGLSKDDVESLRFNAHAYGTNRFVFEGPKPKNLALTFNVDVADGVDVRSNRDMSVRNVNDGAVFAPQYSAYSADPNWKPPSQEEIKAQEAQAKAERRARAAEYRAEHDQRERDTRGRRERERAESKHPTHISDAGSHSFDLPGVREAGRSMLGAGTKAAVAHASDARATGRDAYSPSHSASKGPASGDKAIT